MTLQDRITRWYRRNGKEIRTIRRCIIYPVLVGALILGAYIGVEQVNQKVREREAEVTKAREIQARNEAEEARKKLEEAREEARNEAEEARNEIVERAYHDFNSEFNELQRKIDFYKKERQEAIRLLKEFEDRAYFWNQEKAAERFLKNKKQDRGI